MCERIFLWYIDVINTSNLASACNVRSEISFLASINWSKHKFHTRAQTRTRTQTQTHIRHLSPTTCCVNKLKICQVSSWTSVQILPVLLSSQQKKNSRCSVSGSLPCSPLLLPFMQPVPPSARGFTHLLGILLSLHSDCFIRLLLLLFFFKRPCGFLKCQPFNQFPWFFDSCWAGFMIFCHVEMLDFINCIRFVTFFCFAIWNSSRLLAASSFAVRKNKIILNYYVEVIRIILLGALFFQRRS